MTRRLVCGLGLVMALLAPAGLPAQLAVEAGGGGGVTSVDVQEASGTVTTPVRNEDTGTYQYFARVFFGRLGPGTVGVELGYQYLYYYEVDFSGTTLYRDVDAMRGLLVMRLGARTFKGEIGAGFYKIGDEAVASVLASAGVDLRLAPKFSIPIRARADIVFDEAMTIPLGATVGVRFEL